MLVYLNNFKKKKTCNQTSINVKCFYDFYQYIYFSYKLEIHSVFNKILFLRVHVLY